MSDSTDKLPYEEHSKHELFAMAKWQESRAEAFKEVIAMLTADPEEVKHTVNWEASYNGETVAKWKTEQKGTS